MQAVECFRRHHCGPNGLTAEFQGVSYHTHEANAEDVIFLKMTLGMGATRILRNYLSTAGMDNYLTDETHQPT